MDGMLVADNLYPTRRKDLIPSYITEENEEEIKKILEKKQKEQEEVDVGPTDKKGDIFSEWNLPTVKDPSVFAVSCRLDMEKEAVAILMNKFLYLRGTPEELRIHSASFFSRYPGYVYIEAMKDVHVREAIKVDDYLGHSIIYFTGPEGISMGKQI